MSNDPTINKSNRYDIDSDKFKIFIGGIPRFADDAVLEELFSRYGDLEDIVHMRFPDTKQSRGFGFVTYKNNDDFELALKEGVIIDGRQLDLKKAIPRGNQSARPSRRSPERRHRQDDQYYARSYEQRPPPYDDDRYPPRGGYGPMEPYYRNNDDYYPAPRAPPYDNYDAPSRYPGGYPPIDSPGGYPPANYQRRYGARHLSRESYRKDFQSAPRRGSSSKRRYYEPY